MFDDVSTGTDWAASAACRAPLVHPALFDTDPLRSQAAMDRRDAAAKAVCACCEVRAMCLAHALAQHEMFGVWGGADVAQRARMQRRPA